MKRFFTIAAFLLLSVPMWAQGTITATMDYEVKSPWLTPCSVTIQTNCIHGWRVTEISGGARTVLFDVPAPEAGFTGVLTVTGSGPVGGPTGRIVAQTVGLIADGSEKLSPDSAAADFEAPIEAPTIIIEFKITIIPGG